MKEKELKTIYSDYDNLEDEDNFAFEDFMSDVKEYDRLNKYGDYQVSGYRFSFYPDFSPNREFGPIREEKTCLKTMLNKCFGRDSDYLVVEENEKNGEMIITCVDHDGRNTFHIKRLNKNHRWEHIKFSNVLREAY